MAILRGGKRIGGMDIRIGIPRDRSMDNINRDPRFRNKAGAFVQATTIGRFQSYVNEAEGFARKSKYYVIFDLLEGHLRKLVLMVWLWVVTLESLLTKRICKEEYKRLYKQLVCLIEL